MANQTILTTRILLCAKTDEEWQQSANANLVPMKGEMCLSLGSTPRAKVGDGTTTYSALPYLGLSTSEISALINSALSPINTALDNKVDKEDGKSLTSNDYTNAEKQKLAGIATGAEVNQNAFSNVKIGTTTIAADAKTDTLTIQGGANVSITADANSDTITITSGDTTYETASETVAGIVKLYGSTGNSTDGTMTRKAITDAIDGRVPESRTINGHALTSNISITAADVSAIPTSQKGVASGVAELDSTGKIPSSQLPSYVDDVLEYTNKASFPSTGETAKIYVDKATNLTYRWSGSAYVEISPSIALGTTSSTAFRGDWGKVAYDFATGSHAPVDAEKNVIVTVKRNGTALTPDANRAVDVIVPTKTSELTNDKKFITDTDTAAKATKLATAQNFSISQAVTAAAVSFDGTGAVNLKATAVNARYLTQDSGDVLILDGNFS